MDGVNPRRPIVNKQLTIPRQELAPALAPLPAPPITLDAFIPPQMAANWFIYIRQPKVRIFS
jgi:hypothetical protein